MHPDTDPDWDIRCNATMPPKTACLLRAVLLAGVLSVVLSWVLNSVLTLLGQAAISPHVAFPMMPLHLGVFTVTLPLCLWLTQRLASNSGEHKTLNHVDQPECKTCIRWTPNDVKLIGQGCDVVLSVLEVARHAGAIYVRLKPNSGAQAPFAITMWQANFSKDLFRRLSILVAWHAERAA